MKKKDRDLNRVSMFYDKDLWIVALILLPVIVGGIILVWDEPFFESRNTMWLKIFPFIEVFLILCSLKRRTIDSEGVSKSYLGINASVGKIWINILLNI